MPSPYQVVYQIYDKKKINGVFKKSYLFRKNLIVFDMDSIYDVSLTCTASVFAAPSMGSASSAAGSIMSKQHPFMCLNTATCRGSTMLSIIRIYK